MIKVYGIHSPFVFRVRGVLEAKRLPYEHVSVDMRNRSAAFLALNPIGKIPVLRDGDIVVYDSVQIVAYLELRYPQTRMIPDDLHSRILVGKAIALADKLDDLAYPILGRVFGFRDASDEEIADAHQKIADLLPSLSDLRTTDRFFLREYSYADIVTLSFLRLAERMSIDQGPLADYYRMHLSDPLIARMFPAPDEQGVDSI